MSKVFLTILVVAVQSFPYKKYYCNQIQNNVINTDDNEPFVLYSDSYPSTIQKNCTVTILRTPDPSGSYVVFHMMYSFYDATILQNGTQGYAAGRTYTMRSGTTEITIPFEVSTLYFPKPATNRWNGFQYFFLPPSNRPEGSCPMTDDESIVVNETFVIAIGNFPSDIKLPKLCKWKLQAPAGFALAVIVREFSLNKGDDMLVLEGSVNGTHTEVTFPSDDFVALIAHFDNELEVTLAHNSSGPVINLDIAAFKPSAARCSLAYDGQKFRNCSGRFTNMVSYQRYLPNELCRWTVLLPKSKVMRLLFLENDAGDQTGDSLTVITRTENITCLECSSATDFTISGSNVMDTEVIFEWKTDGVLEYNGFMVDYLIQDCSTTSESSVYKRNWLVGFYAVLLCTIWRRQWS